VQCICAGKLVTSRVLCIGRISIAVLVLVPRYSIFWWWWRMNRMQGNSSHFDSSVCPQNEGAGY
jgi:hypothetical protein